MKRYAECRGVSSDGLRLMAVTVTEETGQGGVLFDGE